ncbi:restriction endonuclease subunit S [Rothia nasimurium]|uniref:restriction endonuclease subunit S n=1 Tax=Rothia nasimurium TaxID=85336 RepID=UPI001F34B366|nr:hypothetical protein [Rothia nasimurium]
MSNEVPFKVRWLTGGIPNHWKIVEPRRIFKLVKEPERPGDIHLTPSQKYGVLPQEEYMKITGARVVQNLSGTQMQHVEPGDFISHLRTFQGGLELATMSGKVSPAYTVLRPTEAVYPGFFKHVLKSPSYISQIASVTDQLRDGQTMRYNEFNLTWLPLPPLDEQKKIADELDHELAEIDEFIADQYRLLNLIDEKFQIQLENLFTKNCNYWTPLKRLGITKKSGFSANGTEYAADINSEIGVLKTGSVTKGDFIPRENKRVDDPIEINKLQTFVEEGSLIVNRANTKDLVGSIGYAEKNYQNLFLSDLLWSISIKKMNPRIIYFYSKTRHYREQISQIHTGTSSTMQKISYENYKNIKIPVTSTDTQQLLINTIDEIYAQKKLVFKDTLNAIDMLNNRKNVIIQFK